MQFKREMADLVLAGDKTQTRRLKPPRYKVGSIQPVQCGYRDKARGHIKILDIREQRLGDITYADARAEGFNSVSACRIYIIKISPGVAWTMRTVLTVYEFELMEDGDAAHNN